MRTTSARSPAAAKRLLGAVAVSLTVVFGLSASAQVPVPSESSADRAVVASSAGAGAARSEDFAGQFEVFPVASQPDYVVSNGVVAGAAEKLIYDNPLGQFAIAFSSGRLVGDDLTMSVQTGCPLTRYRFQVAGKANPASCGGEGMSCGPLRVDFSLYEECPNIGGAPIAGTSGCASTEPGDGCILLPDADALSEINFVLAEPVRLPSSVWLGVRMSRDFAGVVVGAPALVGFSDDVLDTVSFACNATVGGFPARPYSAFNASVYGDASCAETSVAYQNVLASGGGLSGGPLVCLADDISLQGPCNMSQVEVAVRGLGRYDFEFRRGGVASGPAGNCNAISAFGVDAIPGTRFAFVNQTSESQGLKVFRKTFDPPIPLSEGNLFAVMMGNNSNATWVTSFREASIGSSDVNYRVFQGDETGGIWGIETAFGIPRIGFHARITCEGPPPIGVCCDQFIRDAAGEAVLREVPEINCPTFFADPDFRPVWAEGSTFTAEPFLHPCGQAACCEPDDSCENLTMNECDAVEPLDRPRFYSEGQFCFEQAHDCPFNACVSGSNDCMLAHDGAGCSDPFCCTDVCNFDSWCCEVQWDETCERWANEFCLNTPTNDKCAPGVFQTGEAGAVELVVDGPPRMAWGRNATDVPSDPICCNGGVRRCVGGCHDGVVCDDDAACVGANAGFCDYDPNSPTSICIGGCNNGRQCASSGFPVAEVICLGGSNNSMPCAPRCADGVNFGQGCADMTGCPFDGVCSDSVCVGGANDGQACSTSEGCAGSAVCDFSADCPGGTCDNSFCDGIDDGFCGEPMPQSGAPGVGSVWFFFTVPEGVGDTLSVEVSTCGSEAPNGDSMVQAYAVNDTDSGLCSNTAQCGDGTPCSVIFSLCEDGSRCQAMDVPCSLAAPDCPAGSECVLDRGAVCDSLTLIGCNDDAADGCGDPTQRHNSTLCLPDLRRGKTYYVLVAGKLDVNRGTYRVTVSSATSCDGVTSPSNDACLDAVDLVDLDGDGVIVEPFDVGTATSSCRTPSCLGNLQNDVWYRYEPTITGRLLASTCGGSNETTPDTELIIYDGCECGNGLFAETVPGDELCCSSTGDAVDCLGGSDCDVQVVAGNCYLLRLGDNSGSGPQGELTLTAAPDTSCPDAPVTWLDPLGGTIDGRAPIDDNGIFQGVDTVTAAGTLTTNLNCWSLCETNFHAAMHPDYPPELAENAVVDVLSADADMFSIKLRRPITPGEVSTLTYTAGNGRRTTLRFGALPGDVSGDALASPGDILAMIDVLNGLQVPAWGVRSVDCDHSGAVGPPDILCVIDLLNFGWNGISLGGSGDACP